MNIFQFHVNIEKFQKYFARDRFSNNPFPINILEFLFADCNENVEQQYLFSKSDI